MKTPVLAPLLLGLLAAAIAGPSAAKARVPPQSDMDHDLLEVTIPQLHRYYAKHKYTVTQVVQWYLTRIDRYNGIYRAIETVTRSEALAVAAREDAEPASAAAMRGPLWGVPIVIKANTSMAGQVTTDGWAGYAIPGHELIAPRITRNF